MYQFRRVYYAKRENRKFGFYFAHFFDPKDSGIDAQDRDNFLNDDTGKQMFLLFWSTKKTMLLNLIQDALKNRIEKL